MWRGIFGNDLFSLSAIKTNGGARDKRLWRIIATINFGDKLSRYVPAAVANNVLLSVCPPFVGYRLTCKIDHSIIHANIFYISHAAKHIGVSAQCLFGVCFVARDNGKAMLIAKLFDKRAAN